ncbi:unnamed protein product [Schistosoma turkestanicum]|nr:unnamed protein product [Schistosoma turkestanicum]
MAEDDISLSQTADDTDLLSTEDVIDKELSNVAEEKSLNVSLSSHTKEKSDKYMSDHRIVRRIVAEDPNYNLVIVPTLVNLCIKHCTENFVYNPRPLMYLNNEQKRQILDNLPANLPLKVTSHIIDDNSYWARCCHVKWPIIDVTRYDGSWKRAYFERLLEEMIETFVPGTTYAPYLNECVNYAAPYVQCLNIRQLLPPYKEPDLDNESDNESESDKANPTIEPVDHLDLTPILQKLTQLKELSLTYTIKDCGMNFEWSLFQFTITDCLTLSKAIQKHRCLKVFNLTNSHVNSEQCRMLATHLQNHPTLRYLNLSHNSIGQRGVRVLCKLITGNCQLKSLNLTNNHLKATSAVALAQALTQSTCQLEQLNLRLNKIEDEGGIALANALVENSSLKELNLAANDLHEETATHFGQMLTQNTTLTHLDLSNNQIGVVGSEKLQDGMDQNSTLIYFDLRFTGSSQEAEFAISQRIELNQKLLRQLEASE